MTAEQNEEFERTNICWICGKLIDIGENKVKDHDHTKKGNNYRGAAHCNINLKISKKVVVVFHNLRECDSHLIFKELSKFNCGVSVIPNGLEKYRSFTLNKSIVFIDSMLFLNSSLDKLVKTLNDEDFKYLSSVLVVKSWNWLQRQMFILMSIWIALKYLVKVDYLTLIVFFFFKRLWNC